MRARRRTAKTRPMRGECKAATSSVLIACSRSSARMPRWIPGDLARVKRRPRLPAERRRSSEAPPAGRREHRRCSRRQERRTVLHLPARRSGAGGPSPWLRSLPPRLPIPERIRGDDRRSPAELARGRGGLGCEARHGGQRPGAPPAGRPDVDAGHGRGAADAHGPARVAELRGRRGRSAHRAPLRCRLRGRLRGPRAVASGAREAS